MVEISLSGTEQIQQDNPLPVLREDLGLFSATRNAHGEKGWMLHDPVRNRYFRIGESEFLLLRLWPSADGMLALQALAQQHGVDIDAEDVSAFCEFLFRNELIQQTEGVAKRFESMRARRQQTWWKKLLHNYLFLRIPLIQPDALLDRLYPHVRFLFSRKFALATLLVGMLSLILVISQWNLFLSTFMDFLSWKGALAFGSSLVLVKVLHEMGHAMACRHFGLRVPTIGVAFIVMWPVMYTDATEAWRLTSRKARLAIASAGMLVEVSLACYATLMWVLLPEGLPKSVAFTLATTTWLLSLAVNLNPLMRFDGYYIFSDLFNIPNLQERGFELGRNRVRNFLFGTPLVRDPGLLPYQHRIAVVWAWATWVYRFFLFLGIAFLVYEFFFKVLGIFLFVVEIWWFLAAPIWREIRQWKELAQTLPASRKKWFGVGAGILLLLLVLPWQSAFHAPAIMRASDFYPLYAPEEARVQSIHVELGEQVAEGQLLFQLASPDLENRIVRAKADLAYAKQELVRVSSSEEVSSDRQVAEESLAQATAALAGLQQRQARLLIKAPFAGRVRDIPVALRAGRWLDEKQRLGVLVNAAGGWDIEAYVSEDHLRFIQPGDPVRFYPEDYLQSPIAGSISQIDALDTRILPEPYLASTHGGGIPVRVDKDGQAVPEFAVYRVRITPDSQLQSPPQHLLRGSLYLNGDTRSLAHRFFAFLTGVLIRESGF